jgi:lipopolysaccharide/colanic/teichoic acid biosynthesis glycosyltransferase
MARRLLDIFIAACGLAVLALPLAIILGLVWRQDRHSPFYVAERAGLGGVPFRMVKIRSMVFDADKNGIDSTSASDSRITPLGHFIRRWKIDELSQLWNVLLGDMSLVGPRPNTLNEVATYSAEERRLLSARPGVTDFSSIVFSDEGEILRDSADPVADYARLIRPWKCQLGLLYVENSSLMLNVKLITLTILAIFDKQLALDQMQSLLVKLKCNPVVCQIASRTIALDSINEL